jgi:hypothetical protein
MTCKNQQVGCRIDQSLSLFVLDEENVITNVLATCEFCTNGGSECCTDKPHTCGIKNVKCGRGQKHYPADTNCGDCLNEGLECCEPVQKTCSNQGVFCHAGTHKGAFSTILTCTDCENYGEECCEGKLFSRNILFVFLFFEGLGVCSSQSQFLLGEPHHGIRIEPAYVQHSLPDISCWKQCHPVILSVTNAPPFYVKT